MHVVRLTSWSSRSFYYYHQNYSWQHIFVTLDVSLLFANAPSVKRKMLLVEYLFFLECRISKHPLLCIVHVYNKLECLFPSLIANPLLFFNSWAYFPNKKETKYIYMLIFLVDWWLSQRATRRKKSGGASHSSVGSVDIIMIRSNKNPNKQWQRSRWWAQLSHF